MLKGLTIALALAVVAATGCGGGTDRLSKQEYQAKLEAVDKQISQAQQAAEQAFAPSRSSTPAEARQALLDWADAEEQVGRQLLEIHPPSDAEEANRDLAQAQQHFAAAIRNAAAATRGATLAEAPQILEREMGKSAAPKELDRALARLNELGY